MDKKESKEDCVFCKILSGEYESSEIYRDENVVAFLDIQPVNPGHILVIPTEHVSYLDQLDESIGANVFNVGQKMAKAIRKSGVECEGINFFLADGEEAGQEVWHTHLHVFPRFSGDGFGLKHSAKYFQKPNREELNKIAEVIRKKL